jgi:formimidoylglutamate deiminase
MRIFSAQAWLEDGWKNNVTISIENGEITAIETQVAKKPGDITVDTLMPALANLHSHSFQRAMTGMTEYRAVGQDSFWTWRTLMYQFLEHLTPRHIEAIAALVFMEMQEAGYASVGEFHYVHHQAGGGRYDDPAELTNRVFSAANLSGIGLTHLPVLYTYGGVEKAALNGGQLRFGHNLDEFEALVSSAKNSLASSNNDTQVGMAPHSLRATAPDELATVVTSFRDGPVHIHIAEQPKEVQDVQAWLGARPVEWLLDNMDVDQKWCLIHATHMTDKETVDLAASGAVAGLCPITEANLGDGPFNGPAYLNAGGRFGLGSDSNIRISLTEELRTLEYSQRLRDLRRNVMVKGEGSVGKALYLGAAQGGAQALNRKAGKISVGNLADLVAINSGIQSLCGLSSDQLFDGLCFAAGDSSVTDVWSAGRHMVQRGKHIHRGQILRQYKSTMSELSKLMT